MNDLLYYEPIARLLEADRTWQAASTQVRFGYLTLASSFHWNLQKFVGDVSPTYRLAAKSQKPEVPDLQLPYLDDKLSLYVRIDGLPGDDWPTNATVLHLANVHADCMEAIVRVASADVAATLLSNVGHTVVIRVVLAALRQAGRRTVDPGVLEEAISTLCLLSHRRYEGRTPEIAVCFGPSSRRALGKHPAVHFGRHFLSSKKTIVLLKGSSHVIRCLRNGRVIDIIDLQSRQPIRMPDRIVAPRDQFATLAYSFSQGGLTAALTRNGEVLISMGARMLFSWDGTGWRLYPAFALATQLLDELRLICPQSSEAHRRRLSDHLVTTALSLRDDRLGALFVVGKSDHAVSALTKSKQSKPPPVEALYSRLFLGKKLTAIAPQLMCNAAGLDGAVVVDSAGVVRGIGCIFTASGVRRTTEGARTKAALFASKFGVAVKLSQDGEVSIFRDSKPTLVGFSPTW